MKQFFPMGRGERIVLPVLISFAVFSFLPLWRTIEVGGVALFGWFMAFLMVLSPVLTLLVLKRRIRKSGSGTEDAAKEETMKAADNEPGKKEEDK